MTEFPSIFNFWRDECVSCLFLKMFSQVTDDESYFNFFFFPTVLDGYGKRSLQFPLTIDPPSLCANRYCSIDHLKAVLRFL